MKRLVALLLIATVLVHGQDNELLSAIKQDDSLEFSGMDSEDANDACWMASYGRGVGVPISACPAGDDLDGLLCYPECQSDYTGVGPVCWENCPSGFTDTGADCLKPEAYGRGAGYAIWDQSECEQQNPQGCEEWGALWYPICDPGYYAFGCCICSPQCPSDMLDIGVSCQKNSYGRTAGTPMICQPDQEEDAALCYTPCNSSYSGDGPVCWGICPSGWSQCGALCLGNASDCAGDIKDMATTVLTAALDLAEAGSDPMQAIEAIIAVVDTFTKNICNVSDSNTFIVM